MEAFFDASVLIAGTIGQTTGASSIVLSLALLGGLNGVTVDNAIWETRAHLLAEFNEMRLKISFTETKRAIELITGAPTMMVHPWINAPSTLVPHNRKDAYLFAAIELHRPDVLLTLDEDLWGAYLGVPIMSPGLFLAQQELDLQ